MARADSCSIRAGNSFHSRRRKRPENEVRLVYGMDWVGPRGRRIVAAVSGRECVRCQHVGYSAAALERREGGRRAVEDGNSRPRTGVAGGVWGSDLNYACQLGGYLLQREAW